jgi:hypothetical protein
VLDYANNELVLSRQEPYMNSKELNDQIKKFSQRMKSSWQAIFIVLAVVYCPSLYHSFEVNPPIRVSMLGYAENIDLLSFIIAILLAVLIFNLKRKYFSKKFSRNLVQVSLSKSGDLSDQELLRAVLKELKQKMYLIWVLGFLIVLDGIAIYWSIFLTWNMHIYFIVGTFSLILNYPRQELFSQIPWYIVDAKREFDRGMSVEN